MNTRSSSPHPDSSEFSLAPCVTIVTGAGSGIGKAIAKRFCSAGSYVTLADINHSNLELVISEMETPEHVMPITVDVTSKESVDNMVKKTVERWGTLDVLVCSAGITSDTPFLELSLEEWEQMLRTNLTGTFLCCKAALVAMQERKQGSIVNIASVAGKKGGGFFGTSHYAASKGGVLAFTRALAREAIRMGIRVNGICPGPTETPLIAKMDSQRRRQLTDSIPIGRFAEADEIARAALFLASNQSSYCVGECLAVDGGILMD